MYPRFVIPLSIAFAAAGFAAARNFRPSPAASRPAAPPSDSASARPRETGAVIPASGSAGNPMRQGVAGDPNSPPILDHSLDSAQSEESEAADRMLKRWLGRTALARAKPDELEAVIRGATSSIFNQKDKDYQFAVRRLAEIDPERAANLWAGNAYYRIQSDLFLGDWAKKEPAAFASWTLAQNPDVQRASASVLGNLAKADPEKFAQIAASLSSSPAGPIAARSAVEGMRGHTKYSAEQVLDYAQKLPSGAVRDAALAETLKGQQSGAEPSPEALAALARIEPEDARRLGRELVKIAPALPEGPARESAFAASLREQADKDPAAAAKRLEELSGSQDYAAAARGFVEQTARKDPAAAAEWALTIPSASPLQRISALERVASAWFKAAPDDARAWVEKAALSDNEYFQLTGRSRNR